MDEKGEGGIYFMVNTGCGFCLVIRH
jgi:hypothetical protein